jgi:hypothetical protein
MTGKRRQHCATQFRADEDTTRTREKGTQKSEHRGRGSVRWLCTASLSDAQDVDGRDKSPAMTNNESTQLMSPYFNAISAMTDAHPTSKATTKITGSAPRRAARVDIGLMSQ